MLICLPGAFSPSAFQQRLGTDEHRFVRITKHCGQFLHAVTMFETLDRGDSPSGRYVLYYSIVVIPEAGDLWQVGNTDNLPVVGESHEFLANNLRVSATYAGINLVKD